MAAKKDGLERLARVLAGIKKAEQAALAANRARAATLRRQAAVFRARASLGRPAPGAEPDITDLKAMASWQAHADRCARDADARAAEVDLEAEPLRDRFTQTLGRERVVENLMARVAQEAARDAERREEAERLPQPSRSMSAPSTGSPGTE